MKSKLFIVFSMVILFISGCRISEKKEEVVQDSNNLVESSELESSSLDSVLSDNLVYREYSLGEKFNAGEVVISKETLLDITSKPKSVIVYFNDEILETISCNDADIQIGLLNDGVYRFMIMDEEGEVVDITSHIQGISYSEGGIGYLK